MKESTAKIIANGILVLEGDSREKQIELALTLKGLILNEYAGKRQVIGSGTLAHVNGQWRVTNGGADYEAEDVPKDVLVGKQYICIGLVYATCGQAYFKVLGATDL